MIPVPEMANLFTMPLPKDIRYKFHFRPAYGSNKMLIEIFYGVEKEEFLPDFLDALKSFKPKLESTRNLWMNDEIELSFNSDAGDFFLSKDTWGLAFLWSDSHQDVVRKISDLLADDHRFEKVEVDFDKYKKPHG
jgi:hypothetical protein